MRRPGPLPPPEPERSRAEPEVRAPRAVPRRRPSTTEEPPLVAPADAPRETTWSSTLRTGPIPVLDAVADPDAVGDALLDDAPSGDVGPSDPGDAGPGRTSVWRAARERRRVVRAEIRRFTAARRTRRWIWVGAVGAVLVVVLGSVVAAYSPLYGVERIRVEGATTLDPAAIEAALSSQLGAPLAAVDESAVKAALIGFPLIESYRVEAEPPHDLVLRIVERTPVGAISGPAGFSIVDAAGVVVSTAVAPPPGVPTIVVEGGTDGPAFVALGRVVRSLPGDIRARVSEVRATTADDVAFTLDGDGATVVWGSADDSALKALVLARTMAARPPEQVREYDVSSPSAIVVRAR